MALDFAKVQQFRQAAIARGIDPKVVDAFIDEKATLELAKSGLLDPADINDPSTRLQAQQSGTTYADPKKQEEETLIETLAKGVAEGKLDPGTLSAGELKARVLSRAAELGYSEADKPDEKVEAAIRVIDELESTYFREGQVVGLAFGEHGFGGRLKGVGKDLQRKYAPTEESEQLNTYKRVLESSRAQLAKAAGDAGNIALMEQILAGRALPDEQSTPMEAYELFQATRRKFGLEESERVNELKKQYTEVKDKGMDPRKYEDFLQNERRAGGDATVAGAEARMPDARQGTQKLEGLLGLTARVGKTAADFLIPQTQKAVSAAFDPESPMLKIDPEAKGKLGRSLGVAAQQTGEMLKMAAPAGAELALLKGIGKLLGGSPGKAQKVLQRRFAPIKTAKEARIAAAQTAEQAGEKIGSKTLQKTAKQMVEAKIATVKELPALKKLAAGENLKPKEALTLLVKSGKKAFTKSGDPRLTKAADHYSLLRDALREQFSKKVPDVIKETTNIAKAMPKPTASLEPIQRTVRKYGAPVVTGAATAAGVTALLNILGLSRRE